MRINSLKFGNLLIAVIAIQIIVHVTILLDVPFARQAVGFIFLMFVPGIIILKILGLKNLALTETVILSVGLSIAFLMFVGLLINQFGPMIGISKPLSLWTLMITIDVAIFFMYLLACFANRKNLDMDITRVISSTSSRVVLLVFIPLLSVVGTLLVGAYQNNVVLLIMIMIISTLVVLSTLSNKLLPSRLYPVALLMIAIALLLHASLISKYIYGYDINIEYYTFKLTENNSYWNPIISAGAPEYDKINAMLSLTVLPTIFAYVLGLSATWTLKIVFPLVFSFVPLCLYQMYKKQTRNEKVAFLSTFFFMATSAFFTEMLGLARQMIAELFFVLIFVVLWNDKINPLRRRILFILFSAALAVSHYSLSYILVFYISFAWLFVYLLRKGNRRITATMIVMVSVIMFSWYIYVSASSPFYGLLSMGNHVLTSVSADFFSPASRGQDVLRGLGMESAPSLWHSLGRIFAYATEFLIAIGFVELMVRWRKGMRASIDIENFATLSVSVVILVLCVALPGVASGVGMTRYYHIVLIFLSPLCISGVKTLVGFLARERLKTDFSVLVLVLIVLVPYFLFQTGFVYEVTGDSSWSIALSKYRMGLRLYTMGYIDEQDVFGAIWLSQKMTAEHTSLYADDMARNSVLSSYGMTRRDHVEKLSNTSRIEANDTIYLRKMNLLYGVLLAQRWSVESAWNVTEISPVLNNMNIVYSNGGCEIYRAAINETG